MAKHYVNLPLSKDVIETLVTGDQVYLSGDIYTARDQGHVRLIELLSSGNELPVSLRNETIYYVGPAPTPPGKVIGSCGPTTSYRMDGLTRPLLEAGLLGMIGKGKRNAEVIDAIVEYGAVYFQAIGGAGALLASCVVRQEVIAFDDLGPEAFRRLTVRDFPVIVAIDCRGNDIFNR